MFHRLSIMITTKNIMLRCDKKLLSNLTDGTKNNIKSDVINLYKNLLYLSRDWHTDIRPQIKKAFLKNRDVTDIEEIQKLIAKGEYICREITATYHLKKYRTMKRRYYSETESEKNLEELYKNYNK